MTRDPLLPSLLSLPPWGRPMAHGRGRRGPLTAAAAAVLVALVVLGGCSGSDEASEAGEVSETETEAERQADVAERGAEVMPFDLDATTHRFEPTDDGLVQTVVADDPDDAEQVALVREHIAEEARRFRRGDYGDPAVIHGYDMPGLADLEAGAAAVTVELADVDAGARLSFLTDDPALVDALHAWGEAQLMDHGAHAEGT